MTPQPFLIRVFRTALRLLPRRFRHDYADGMEQMFTQRLGEAGGLGALRVFTRELMGVLAAAVRQRLAPTAPARGAGPAQRRKGTGGMTTWLKDVRMAARRLVRSPLFSGSTVATLALAIGANSAIYSVVRSVVLKPLPYPDADRVVWLDHGAAGLDLESGLGLTRGLYLYYQQRSRNLDAVAVFRSGQVTITGDGTGAERLAMVQATFTLSDVLGVPPLHGRWFREDDRVLGGDGVVVLSHGLWTRRYGRDESIVGRTVRLDGIPVTVVGVMPERFAFPDRDTQLWIPHVINPADGFGGFAERGVGRLAAGVTAEDAMIEIDRLITQLPEVYNEPFARQVVDDARISARVIPLKEYLVGDIERILWILLGTVGLVLLIACANVANLFLVRAETRYREVAVRTALGATRRDLVRYFLTESTVLAVVAGAIGLGLAHAGVRLLIGWGPANLPRLDEIGVDANVFVFTVIVSLAASLLFGLVPATRPVTDLGEALKSGSRTMTAGRRQFRMRQVLVVVQIAMALVLLIGSGLMARSFWHLKNVDPGFDARGVLTFEIGLSNTDYQTREAAAAFQQRLLDRLRALPGVASVGAVSPCLPLNGWCGGDPLRVQGRAVEPGEIPPVVAIRTVTPGYFETMKIPLLAGRTFDRGDHERRTDGVVIGRKLADLYWPNADPIGQRVHDRSERMTGWYTVIGVVGDTQASSLMRDGDPLIYFPLLSTDSRGPTPHTMQVVVRSDLPPLDLVTPVRAVVRSMDSNVPVARVQTLERLVADAGIQMAFGMVLLGIAAGVALILGTVGVYSVISYIVSRRTGEIGVRLALGARRADVSGMVLRQGAILAVIGIALGLGSALASSRVMQSVLFGVTPTDPLTYAAVAGGLLAVAALACYLPARRAGGVDPLEALRGE